MDQHVDLRPLPDRTQDERRAAAALADLAGEVGSRDLRGAGGPDTLAAVHRRAVGLRRRRRTRGAVLSVTAVAAAVTTGLLAPVVVPGGGIVAALGLSDQGGVAPERDAPTTPAPNASPGPVAVTGLPVLTDQEVTAFADGVPGAGSLVPDGALALAREPRSARIGDVGGWCGDTPLTVELPATASWAAAWRGLEDASGPAVGERVLAWGLGGATYPVDVEGARAYVEASAASTVTCPASSGADARTFRVLAEPAAGVVQAAAPAAGEPGSWEVRTVAPTASAGVIDLTVVVAAPTAQEAGRTVQPLLEQALARASAWAPAQGGGAPVLADPTANAPGTVVRAYDLPDGLLTLEQVGAVLPGAVDGPPDRGWQGEGPITVGCQGPFFIPDGATNPEGSAQLVFQAPGDGGTTSVTERLLRYEDGTAQDYASATNGPATVCDPAAEEQAWRAVGLRHDGSSVEVLVRHPDGDPQRWVVRSAVAVDPATAVDLQVEMTASSEDEVAAVVQPLLAAARQRAYGANFVPSAP